MFRRYRRRHGDPAHPTLLRYVICGVLFGLVVFASGKKIASLIDQVGSTQTVAAVLHVPDRSSVEVSLDGGTPQRAENGLRLYPGDQLTIGANARGFVTFFDGSIVGLDEGSALSIDESLQGKTSSTINISLIKGRLWINTPTLENYTGSIIRSVRTPAFFMEVSSHTEGMIAERMLQLFTADGLGGRIEVPGVSQVVYIGEGQQFSLPEDGVIGEDLYIHRSPLGDSIPNDVLVIAGRAFVGNAADIADQEEHSAESPLPPDEILTVTSPINNTTVAGETVQVEGTVGKGVQRIRINGYMLEVNAEGSAFTYELSLPRDPEVSIVIEALDEKGIPLVGLQRTIKRDIEAPVSPTILLPSGSGTIYRTSKTELEIRGSAPLDAVGITVNDYRLQLFVQGDPEWSYLASLELGNLVYGRNAYEVRAIDTSGNISPGATITILLEEGEEGVVQENTAEGHDEVSELVEWEPAERDDSNEQKNVKPTSDKSLTEKPPDNRPIMPGSLKIIGPTVGEPFTATGSEFSIYGIAPEEAYSIWINGYRLRLYKPGEPVWKYIASYSLGTMKRGKNVYHIVLRNRTGEVLDQVNYTVYYRVE